MAKEFEDFRFVLNNLNEVYEGKQFITIKELCEKERCDPKTAKRRYNIPVGARGIDVAVLARKKCAMAGGKS